MKALLNFVVARNNIYLYAVFIMLIVKMVEEGGQDKTKKIRR